jgi:hypothetical protein
MKSISLIILISLLFSCKKKTYHKVRFEFKVIQQSKYGITTPIYLSILPRYEREPPKVNSRLTETWYYEYLGLKDGDKIFFSVDIPLSTYYEKWVYVDGKEVAYKKIKVSDSKYYSYTIIESRGLEDLEGWGEVYKE